MTKRTIIQIDEEKCIGCGVCANSCHQGAIEIINGKAKLVREDYCDGLGRCLKECPVDAIKLVQVDALPATPTAPSLTPAEAKPQETHGGGHACACPGAAARSFAPKAATSSPSAPASGQIPSELRQWPVQLHLVPPTAPYFRGADVLLAADCTAFALGGFHGELLRGKALAIACPKLDDGQDIYVSKLISMIDEAQISSLTVAIMEVPCCGGLKRLAELALSRAQRKIPLRTIVVGIEGDVRGQ
jgi:ferredoxin